MTANPRLFERLFAAWRGEQNTAQEPDTNRAGIATSVILLEAAGADHEFSPAECQKIIEILQRRCGVAQEEAEELIVAAEKERAEPGDLWRFTNHINQAFQPQEKRQIIEEVWRVIYADGILDGHEDYLIHKLARLLNLDHSHLIEAKLRVLNELRNAK